MSEKVKKQSPFRTPGEETVSSPGASSSIYEEVAIRLSLEAWLFLLDGEKACSTEREHCDVCSWVTGAENCRIRVMRYVTRKYIITTKQKLYWSSLSTLTFIIQAVRSHWKLFSEGGTGSEL